MEKEELKELIKAGNLESIKIVLSDLEKYKDVVIWAATNEITKEPQVDGTNYELAYQLIRCYGENDEIFDVISKEFLEVDEISWRFYHMAQIMCEYALKNNKALDIMKSKYNELYDYVQNISVDPAKEYVHEVDDLEKLAKLIAFFENEREKIKEDIKALISKSKYLDNDFYDDIFTDLSRMMNILPLAAFNSYEKEAYVESLTKNISTYLDSDGRLVQNPKKRRQKIYAICYLAEFFEEDEKYTEDEINIKLIEHHTFNDPATLRREMYNMMLLNRSLDGRVYTLNPDRPKAEELIAKYCK